MRLLGCTVCFNGNLLGHCPPTLPTPHLLSKDMLYKKRASDAMRQLIDNNPNRNYAYLDI